MNTPNETQAQTRSPRPNFWLRAIEHRKHQLTREYRATLGDTAREGISDEDYATTMATLETMARNLGWTEEEQEKHRHGRPLGRPFGPGAGRGAGRGMGRGHFGETGGFGRTDRFDQDKTAPVIPTETPEA